MKLFIIKPLFLIMFVVTMGLQDASAKPFKELKCVESNMNSNYNCKFKEKLKPLETMEFRGLCAQMREEKTEPDSQKCHENHRANSCTITLTHPKKTSPEIYGTCSCTNWDPTKSHNVKIDVNCPRPWG